MSELHDPLSAEALAEHARLVQRNIDLRKRLTRANALELLRAVACPVCKTVGDFQLFAEPNNGGVGLRCRACSAQHPLLGWGVMWIKDEKKRPPNDLAAVMKARGAYCYACGTPYTVLRALSIRMHVHHALPFSEHGDAGPTIPVCGVCHYFLNAIQPLMKRLRGAFEVKAADAGNPLGPPTIPPERLRHLARRLHQLGERPLFELLAEVDRGAPLGPRLERYAQLHADVVNALGADRLPSPVRLVPPADDERGRK